jgi:hypothetical protein
MFQAEKEIVSAAGHERGNLKAGEEVHGIGFGQLVPVQMQTNTPERSRLQALFPDCENGQHSAKANTKDAKAVSIHIRTAHQIINRGAEIFGLENQPIALRVGAVLRTLRA